MGLSIQGDPEHDAGFKGKEGDSWAPYSSDMKPCVFFPRGYLKELMYKPLPTTLQDLRERITREFSNLLEAMVAKGAFGIKKCSLKLLKTGEEAFTGKKIRL